MFKSFTFIGFIIGLILVIMNIFTFGILALYITKPLWNMLPCYGEECLGLSVIFGSLLLLILPTIVGYYLGRFRKKYEMRDYLAKISKDSIKK